MYFSYYSKGQTWQMPLPSKFIFIFLKECLLLIYELFLHGVVYHLAYCMVMLLAAMYNAACSVIFYCSLSSNTSLCWIVFIATFFNTAISYVGSFRCQQLIWSVLQNWKVLSFTMDFISMLFNFKHPPLIEEPNKHIL